MSFLAPLFLAGALGIGLPILFHLIRQTSKERQVFSSLMFLAPTPPRLTRRSRLEHIALLALRCLVVLLLAFGFARPFVKKPVFAAPTKESAKRVIVLLDRSASMRRGGIWEKAQSESVALVRGLAPGDVAAFYAYDRGLTPLMTFEEWKSAAPADRSVLLEARIAELEPTWLSSRAGDAVTAASDMLADLPGVQTTPHLIVISDMQEGARWDLLQGYEWPRGITVEFRPIKAANASNASVQLLNEADPSAENKEPRARVRVSNAPDSTREQFALNWVSSGGQSGQVHQVQIPPGQSRTVNIQLEPTATNIDRIVLSGDDEPFDNSVFIATPPPTRLQVLYFGEDDGTNSRQPLYFLKRAFQDSRAMSVQVLSRNELKELTAVAFESATALVVTSPLNASDLVLLKEHVRSGKTALITLQQPGIGKTLGPLLDVPELSLVEEPVKSFAMWVDVDYQHPLLATFADPRFSDFTRIRYWRTWKVDTTPIQGAKVLAKFDHGAPALIEAPVGKGRLLILASSWRPEDSQLALSTKFVPLLYTLLEQSGAPPEQPLQFFAGDSVTKNGTNVVLSTPGVYKTETTNVATAFAVNMDPAESRTWPIALDELERLGVPLRKVQTPEGEKQRIATQLRLANTELESRQKLWRWLVLGALGLLLLETWLAGRAAPKANNVPAGG